MKIYWATPVPPELSRFTTAQRKQVWIDCFRSRSGSAKFLQVLPAGLGAGVGALLGDLMGPGWGLWGAGIGGAIGGFIASQIGIQQTLNAVRQRYRSTPLPPAPVQDDRGQTSPHGERDSPG